MNKHSARKLKLYTVAILLGAGLAIHLSHSVVKAQVVEKIEKPWKVTRYVITESAIIAQKYTLGKYAANEYAQYIWNKWAPHGNRAQAVALCTNIAEGHLDDSATHVNPGNGTDRGCWQWSDKYHPDVTDEVARNCFKATDLTYNVWQKRMNMGIQDGFAGMWYGYGSKNYNLCIESLLSL